MKSGLAAELLESEDGQAWSTSNKAFPLSLTCRETGGQKTGRRVSAKQTGTCV